MAALLTEEKLNEPVTRHMRREVSLLQAGQTVGEALESLRRNPPRERIIYFYVVDADNRLKGVVPTRRLLLSPLERPVAEIMIHNVVALPDQATVLDACEFFTLHRLLAFPVVDAERRLIGLVDVELYTEELRDLGSGDRPDDLFQLIGVHLSQARHASPWISYRTRFPWLACNLGGGILAAFLSGLYQEELSRAVALALFIPVVLALAESVGIQSVSLALEALHGQTITWPALWRRLPRELGTGLLLGLSGGLVVGTVALLWIGDPRVALSLLGGIAGGVAAAAGLGLALPTVLRLCRRDPRVAAGPVALAAADIVTLLCYFNLARWLMSP